MNLVSSEVIFCQNLIFLHKIIGEKQNFFLIVDRKIARFDASFVKKYRDRIILVSAGEELKQLASLSLILKRIQKLVEKKGHPVGGFFAIGGGSVGDFTGFLASIYKRGVPLVHVPTTWLAAVDSAHGGKTALNNGNIKNQVGTFYSAQQVLICREFFESLPQANALEAWGEVFKIGLIHGGKLWKKVSVAQSTPNQIWDLLPELIRAKMNIVKKDPYEKRGLRQVLNLGHTIGHVIEAALLKPHGAAVLYGLRFSMNWSLKKGYLSERMYSLILSSSGGLALPTQQELASALRKIPNSGRFLVQDKKRQLSQAGKNSIQFIFIRAPGKCFVQKVTLAELGAEWTRQSRVNQ